MLLWHSAVVVLAGRVRRRRSRILHLRVPILRHRRHARRQVLAARALAVRRILPLLRPQSPIPRLLHLRHQAAVHLAARALVVPVQFLAVHAARRRPPALVVHREVLLRKVTAYRVKRPTAGKRIPTKAAPTPLAIAVQAL